MGRADDVNLDEDDVDDYDETRLDEILPDDDGEKKVIVGIAPRKPEAAQRFCPFLDSINRHVLDFDFEKVCSISNSHLNVYACLVCGKYFCGRARGSPVYFHALEHNHHVFMKLDTGKVYCIPDNYEVSSSLHVSCGAPCPRSIFWYLKLDILVPKVGYFST